MFSPSIDATALGEENKVPPPRVRQDDSDDSDNTTHAREISMWVRGLRSFFNLRNHPFADASQSNLITHDWSKELRIVHATLLRCSQLVFQAVHFEDADHTIFDEVEAPSALSPNAPSGASEEMKPGLDDASLLTLAAALGDDCASCQLLLDQRPVSLHAWLTLGEQLDRNLGGHEGTKALAQLYSRKVSLNIPPPLLDMTRAAANPPALGADLLYIFSSLYRLLEHLGFVETFLRKDQSLKQTLPIFTLVHEEARTLAEFIETRSLKIEGLEKNVFDALDSMNYAIRMELRKVFGHELVGTSSLRQAPLIYVKVENAHGLLRDSFQQSLVGLSQLFDPALDGAQLFDQFRTRLEQSLALRRDLWTLMQLVRRGESEPDYEGVGALIERLEWFRDGSLRYLMFKDWESCERFIEEVEAARGNAELAAVLHRFAAYLEALSSQVNMRAVLFNHPFDYPALEGH
jgi:hypothetical protein